MPRTHLVFTFYLHDIFVSKSHSHQFVLSLPSRSLAYEVHRAANRRVPERNNKRDQPSRLICYRCGDEDSHTARNCPKPRRTFKCTKCGKGQHLAKACRQRTATDRQASHGLSPPDTRPDTRRTNYTSEFDDSPEDDDPEGLFVVRLRDNPPESDEVIMRPVVVTVVINRSPLNFEVDSGASRTIISYPTSMRISDGHPPPLYDSDVDLVTWGDDCTLRTSGRFFANVHFKGRTKHLPVVVGTGSGPSLLGRNWFVPFGLSVEGVLNLTEITPTPSTYTPTLSELLNLPPVTGKGTG